MALVTIDRFGLTQWRHEFTEWAEFVLHRLGLLEVAPVCYGQEVVNEFMWDGGEKTAPKKLRAEFAVVRKGSWFVNSPYFLRKIKAPKRSESSESGSALRGEPLPPEDARVVRIIESPRPVTVIPVQEAWLDHAGRRAYASGGMPLETYRLPLESFFASLVDFSPNREYLAGGRAFEEHIKIWEVDTGELTILDFPHPIGGVSFTKSGPLCLIVTNLVGEEWAYELIADTELKQRRDDFSSYLFSVRGFSASRESFPVSLKLSRDRILGKAAPSTGTFGKARPLIRLSGKDAF
jgi:hypothetical protein